MRKFNAKYVRLALNALNLCNITLKISAKKAKPMPKLNAKYVRLALNALKLSKIYAKNQL